MNYENYEKQVLSLAKELHLPTPVLELLENKCALLPWEGLHENIIKLTNPCEAEGARIQLVEALVAYGNENGMAELAVMLAAALHTRKRYEAIGISNEIYFDTMGCFKRFLEETKNITGGWKFDRGFWTWRQTAGLLYRIGTLEFEYTKCFYNGIPQLDKEDMIISVHIPSYAKLTEENLSKTYEDMEVFYRKYQNAICHKGVPQAVVCHTWLLSPSLLQFLGENSGIRNFAKDYEIYDTDADNDGCLTWLFNGNKELLTLPENTSLQKEVKKYLSQGGVIGHGFGRLKKPCVFS
jgi:hypothetical protein